MFMDDKSKLGKPVKIKVKVECSLEDDVELERQMVESQISFTQKRRVQAAQ